jgi:osmotically-inducible protein OsmY
VDSLFEKTEADDAASRVKGVLTVNNLLNVENDEDFYIHNPYVDDRHTQDDLSYRHTPRVPAKGDSEIKKDIESELKRSPFVNAEDITVRVKDGTATLSGTVESWSEHKAAAENAYDGGAVRVNNDLAVVK